MILQALTKLYDDLVSKGKIPRPGWNPAKISYALCLDENGQLEYVLPVWQRYRWGKRRSCAPHLWNFRQR